MLWLRRAKERAERECRHHRFVLRHPRAPAHLHHENEHLFVDDLRENCEGAEAVGMVAVLHRGADETLARLEELLEISLRN